MRFSEARGRKIVSTSTAHTVGTVRELVVDPATRRVVGVTVKGADKGAVLLWSDLTSFGGDAVTVDGPERLSEPDEHVAQLADKDHAVLGKRVLSTDGLELGKVRDVAFDPESGSVTTLDLDGDDVPGERLVGIGSWAVVVRPG